MEDKTFWLLVAVLVVTTGIFAFPLIAGTAGVDDCVNAGGQWDAVAGLCDFRPEPSL